MCWSGAGRRSAASWAPRASSAARARAAFTRCFSADGSTLTPLDQRGRPLQPLRAGTGLIAATRNAGDGPIWVVTGTDASGVALAAKDFNQATLRDRFAVAVTPAGPRALPQAEG